jgi:hypothetical protein
MYPEKKYNAMTAEQRELADFRIAERIKDLVIFEVAIDKNGSEYKVRVYKELFDEIQGCFTSLDLSRSMAALYKKQGDIIT